MSDIKSIYAVDVKANAEHIRLFVSAGSSSTAKAFVARTFVDSRRATAHELLGIDASQVIDADTGLPIGAQPPEPGVPVCPPEPTPEPGVPYCPPEPVAADGYSTSEA